jgi:hypothetical protein
MPTISFLWSASKNMQKETRQDANACGQTEMPKNAERPPLKKAEEEYYTSVQRYSEAKRTLLSKKKCAAKLKRMSFASVKDAKKQKCCRWQRSGL